VHQGCRTPDPPSTLLYSSQLTLYQVIKNFQNNSFDDYKILYENNTTFSFIWITGANSNRNLQTGKENIISESSGNYNIEIRQGIKILKRNWIGIYRHNFSYKRKKVGRCLK
jgi:hypothetical protein